MWAGCETQNCLTNGTHDPVSARSSGFLPQETQAASTCGVWRFHPATVAMGGDVCRMVVAMARHETRHESKLG